MAEPTVKQGDKNDAVRRAQELLNRDGAILEEDGDFGGGTGRAVRECQSRHGVPATGIVDAATWAMLHALPEPCPDISTSAVAAICRYEVSGRPNYDARLHLPVCPPEQSGVTIGIGYDLKHMGNVFATDWAGLIPQAMIDALRPCLGKLCADCDMDALRQVVSVPFHAAWTVFIRRSLPSFVVSTRNAFPGFDALSPLCRGALVSLVFNRGAAMNDNGPPEHRRREMREIRDAIAQGRPQDVPALFRSMKRLWAPTSGLIARREDEARMFERGLAH